jgi:hypothetical protein
MAVRLVSDEVRAERSRALLALHQAWAAEQIAAGVDGPTPEDRKEPSDYNQHVPDLEAPGAALDAFWSQADRILAL